MNGEGDGTNIFARIGLAILAGVWALFVGTIKAIVGAVADDMRRG